MIKKMLKIILLMIFIATMSNSVFAITEDEKLYLKEYCNEYGVNINIAYAIMFVENKDLENDIINFNTDGSYDFGFFQINSVHKEKLCKKLEVDNIIEPKNNIKAGVYLLKTCSDKVFVKGLPLDIKYIAAMYHKPKDLEAVINEDEDNDTYVYSKKVEKNYIQITLNDIYRRTLYGQN